MFLMS